MNIERPVGVSIATLWAGLFAGVFSLGLFLFFYFGPAKGLGMINGLQFALSVGLSIGIIFSAIGAWKGAAPARNILVVLVLIHYGLLAYQNYQLATAGIEIRGSTLVPWATAIRSVVTAMIIAGYLMLSRKAKEFYNQ